MFLDSSNADLYAPLTLYIPPLWCTSLLFFESLINVCLFYSPIGSMRAGTPPLFSFAMKPNIQHSMKKLISICELNQCCSSLYQQCLTQCLVSYLASNTHEFINMALSYTVDIGINVWSPLFNCFREGSTFFSDTTATTPPPKAQGDSSNTTCTASPRECQGSSASSLNRLYDL